MNGLACTQGRETGLREPGDFKFNPLQFEVIFQQIAHTLAVISAWGPSSTSELSLDTSLQSLHSLLRTTVASAPTAELMCTIHVAQHGDRSDAVIVLQLASAPMQLSAARRAACVSGVRLLCELPGTAL